MDEKYILVSLEEERSKQLANVLSNDTSRKILDYLADKNVSETDLALKLNMPISTVHYNVQNLLKNNLVEIKDFLYSEKGNKINIYGITNKMIVILPKGVEAKNIILSLGASLVAAAVIYAFSRNIVPVGEGIAEESADVMLKSIPQVNEAIADNVAARSIDLTSVIPVHVAWFLIGAGFAIALYSLIDYIRKKK